MRRHHGQLVLLTLLLALCARLALTGAVRADEKTYYWDYIRVDITVQTNGDLDIVETQRYVFTEGSFTYAYRDLPLDRVESIDNVWIEENGQRYGPDQMQVEDRGDVVVLRPAKPLFLPTTIEEVRGSAKYHGPPIPMERWNEGVDATMREMWEAFENQPR